MHLLFSVRVNAYSSQQRLFACLVELTAKPPPPVVEIPGKALASRPTVQTVPQVDHVTQLVGDLPAQLLDEAMQEGWEVSWDGAHGLGLMGVDLFPPGLRI